MIKPKMKQPVPRGFTIVELSIATVVFSIILLVALASFFQIGRLFYKGVTLTQTQETARQIETDITGNIDSHTTVSQGPVNRYSYYCIRNVRYTYNLGHAVDLDQPRTMASLSPGGNFGILKDVFPGDNACAPPCKGIDTCSPAQSPGTTLNNATELLGQNMRVNQFNIPLAGGGLNLYNFSLVVAYGDDDVFDNASSPDVHCLDDSRTQTFCSVARVETSVFRGRM